MDTAVVPNSPHFTMNNFEERNKLKKKRKRKMKNCCQDKLVAAGKGSNFALISYNGKQGHIQLL